MDTQEGGGWGRGGLNGNFVREHPLRCTKDLFDLKKKKKKK